MQNYHVELHSEPSTSYRCQRAANSLDIDITKKLTHVLDVAANLTSPFNIGLIVGASGSGKTTLAHTIFGAACFLPILDLNRTVLDQLPVAFDYDECAKYLNGIGLNSVPCWIRPASTLSNGQRTRAEAALHLAHSKPDETCAIDEWTSVVDRTVAKAMSHCVQKLARKLNRRFVLCSCHYDVVDWLCPDWVIDCNKGTFTTYDTAHWDAKKKSRQLRFDIRQVPRTTWRYFSKYHYLTERLPGGLIYTFGLFHENEQIGFQCFANYVPKRREHLRMQMHSNRTVIHPDYCGLGLGIKLIDATSAEMLRRGFDIRAKYTSEPVFRAMRNNPAWKLLDTHTQLGKTSTGGNMMRQAGFRENVTTYSFKFIGNAK